MFRLILIISLYKVLIKKNDEVILNEILTKYDGKFVKASSSLVQALDQVMQTIIESNKEFVEDENFDLNWTCTVIDDDQQYDLIVNDEMKFVITTKATAQLCQNEHQLAYLVANALAHFVLKHKRESVSFNRFCTFFNHILFSINTYFRFQTSNRKLFGQDLNSCICLGFGKFFRVRHFLKIWNMSNYWTRWTMVWANLHTDNIVKLRIFRATVTP